MEENAFYTRFKEEFLDWFDENGEENQRNMLEDVLGYSIVEHELWNDEDTDLREIAEDISGQQWYEYCQQNINGGYPIKDFGLYATIVEILTEAANTNWDFSEEFIDSYASEMINYSGDAEGFFKDLQTGGCASGMVGGLIYYNDVRKIYVDNMDSIDQYLADLENELGCPVLKSDDQPRFNYAVWAVYEEYAYRIWWILFEDYS